MKPIQHVRSRDELIEYFNRGNRIRFLHFWSHRSKKGSSIGKHCFSQWFPSPFVVENVTYYTAEHYMMAGKARLFADFDAFETIIETKNPGKAKHFGRTIKGAANNGYVGISGIGFRNGSRPRTR